MRCRGRVCPKDHMAVKRDYGSFAKASARFLAPLVEPLCYRPWSGCSFNREKSGWVEGFGLQQSQWGGGNFCVNIGINVPGLEEVWALNPPRGHGLLIAWRLSDAATEDGGERWYRARNKEQLENNLRIVAETLARADCWFQQFQTFSDVVEQYRVRSGLPTVPTGGLQGVSVTNYGILLLLAGDKQHAATWLQFARELAARPMYWDPRARRFSYQRAPGLRLVKPSKDSELHQRAIATAFSRLET